jgi:hypothetical protein
MPTRTQRIPLKVPKPMQWVYVALATATLTACTPKLCDPAIDPNNAQYDVSVSRIYTMSEFYSTFQGDSFTSGTPSCGGIDGIGPGSVLRFRTTGQTPIQHGQCNNVTAELVAGPAELTIQENTSTIPLGITPSRAGVVMYAMMNATFATCAGELVFEAFAGPGNVFAPPITDGGGRQPAILYRFFYPSNDSCPACQDNFVVQFATAADAAAPGGAD